MDRDGTASFTRGGWTNIMAAHYAEHLPPLAFGDGVVAVFHRARQIVEALIAS